MVLLCEVPGNRFLSKMGKRNSDVGIVGNESVVEVAETKEGLNVFDFLQLWPILYSFDFVIVHTKTSWREDVSKVFHSIRFKFTFVCACIETMFSETFKDFYNICLMAVHCVRVNEDVVQINCNTDI